MAHAVPLRADIAVENTWDLDSIFPTADAWERAYRDVEVSLPRLEAFQGRLGNSPSTLAEWFETAERTFRTLEKVAVYANSLHDVDTADEDATAMDDRAIGLYARVAAATSFEEPEILAIGRETLDRWMEEDGRLRPYRQYFDNLERRRAHIRSAEVEEILGLAQDPLSTASTIHRTLSDTDLTFAPARSSSGEEIEVAQGNIGALLTDPDREIRRTVWESDADAHLAFQHTLATCLTTGVKRDVFQARARGYPSSLEAALFSSNIPVEVFTNLIDTFRRNVPIWHRYWEVRRRALGYESLYPYDVAAPLTKNPPQVPFEQSVEWIVEGMRPLGDEYASALQRGVVEQRWVDIYPNQNKRSGAYSTGSIDTHPFILMSYTDDLLSMSTLAHELGHSMHSYYTYRTQPYVYSDYSLFVAEVASNFNQALVRAYLLDRNDDPDFQIAVIEEAMANFHRYFFIMPTLARLELEIHQRVERGEALNAAVINGLTADLFREAYGEGVVVDPNRVGIVWAQFPIHMYLNFYVYQYATGISAAHALAQGVLQEGAPAAQRYLDFLKAGGSVYPLDALRMAGVDMRSPDAVQKAFDVMRELVERLGELVERN